MQISEAETYRDQQLEQAIRRLESHPEYLDAELWTRRVLNGTERKASPKNRVYGNKARLKFELHLIDIRGSAFLRLVTDMAMLNDYILVVQSWESIFWKKYLGCPPATDQCENAASQIRERLEDWATAGFQQLVNLQENETAGLSDPASEQPEDVHPRGTVNVSRERRAAVDAYIAEVFRKTGRTITQADIWKAAKYKTRSAFERWQRNDSKHPNREAHRRFTKILKDKPHLKNI